MMDQKLHALVPRPVVARTKVRIGVGATKLGPPVELETLFEAIGIDGADDVSTDAGIILDYERVLRLQPCIGARIDVADELGVAVEGCGVLARVAGLKTNT